MPSNTTRWAVTLAKTVSTTSTGHQAEDAAADYLRAHGFKIVEQNWRTRLCEIDIVAEKKKSIYFVEVKYRKSNAQGDGLDYITHAKLRQMRFAAESWVAEHDWTGDYQLAAIEVNGPAFEITNFVESA